MVCGKVFNGRNWKQNLEYHLHTHTKYKPFKCPICSHCSSLKHNLIRHIRNNHKELFSHQNNSQVCFGEENSWSSGLFPQQNNSQDYFWGENNEGNMHESERCNNTGFVMDVSENSKL